jgi:CheY-like chemotaxis protein
LVVRLPLADGKARGRSVKSSVAPSLDKTRRVLVVDDNRDAADTLGALVGVLGADVRVVYDGAAALELIDDFRPDVVVLDLGMPDMDGYEVARRIRERYNGTSPRIIALTGWGQEKDRRRTEAAGFNYHLVKPVDLDAMQAVLGSVGHPLPSSAGG